MSETGTSAERRTPSFRHERIDSAPPADRLTFCLATDLTGSGRDDVIVGAMGARNHLYVDGKRTRLPSLAAIRKKMGFGETCLFWYENPGWTRHKLAEVERLGVGHTLGDVDGDGRVDVVAGSALHHNEVYWFRQPSDPRDEWERHVISRAYEKYHDVGFADVDDDGEPEVIGLSQEGEAIFYYDVPDDPTREPWPETCHHLIADDVSVEGLSVLDVDGDGRTEVVAGTDLYRRPEAGGGTWHRESILTGWDDVRVTSADLDGDGREELVFAEGDSPTYGTHPGRVAWVDTATWSVEHLADDLFCPHTLQTGDVTGNGLPDIVVGEMSLGEHSEPRILLFVNQGGGRFESRVVSTGVAIHEGKLADLTGNGRADIVGKSYTPDPHVDAWRNTT